MSAETARADSLYAFGPALDVGRRSLLRLSFRANLVDQP